MRRSLFATLALTVSLCAQALGAQVIDQNAPINNSYMAGFGQTDLAQSFKQTAGNIAGAGIFLRQGIGGGGGTLTIKLWDLLPNQVGATLLTSGSTAINATGTWADVFWAPVSITSGQTYYLEFLSSNLSYGIAGDTQNGYANGQVYANAGFGSFPSFDYTFRTYSSNVTVTPEPATVTLMLGGLGALAVAVRRKRRA